MMTLPIGFILILAVLVGSAGEVNLKDYMNFHSVLIVLGGTLAVLAIGTPTKIVKGLFHNIIALFKKRIELQDAHSELMALANNRAAVTSSKDPLINYSISLWERGIDPNSFQALLSQYRDMLENEEAEVDSALHNLAKYPPALGMMGTVMGMISLFANLGSSDKSGLGPALATAMTATFYGLLLANAFLSPLADRMTVESIHRKKYFGMVYEILTLINRREPISLIEEEFKNREAS
jgi:chemotaxis protein MotA